MSKMLDSKAVLEKIRGIENVYNCFKISEIGEIRYDDYAQPILAVEPREDAGEKVLITAGIHGDEPAGVLAVIEFLELFTSRAVDRGYTIIPCVNLWGCDNHSRLNRIGRDVNRDFRYLETQEASLIAQYLSGKAFDLVLDLHEDPYGSKGYYLYCLSNSRAIHDQAEKVIQQVRRLGLPVENRMKVFPFRTRAGIIAVPYWASYLTEIVNRLAFCNWCRTAGVSRNVVVTETPTSIPLEERVAMQLLSLETLTEQDR